VALVFVEFLNLNNNKEVKTKPKIAVINKILFNRKLFYKIKVICQGRPAYIKNGNANANGTAVDLRRTIAHWIRKKHPEQNYMKSGRWNIPHPNRS